MPKRAHGPRQVAIAVKLFGAMGIERHDKAMRQDWVMRGFQQFDAPVSMVLTYDGELDPGAVVHFDLGALCSGICLAAWDRGLGTVVNGQGIMRSEIVREEAGIPDSEVIMTCIALGYSNEGFVGTVPEMIDLVGQYEAAGIGLMIIGDRNDEETRELLVSEVLPRFT